MSNEEIVRILKDYSDFFSLDSIVGTMLRGIGWVLVKALAYIADGISAILDKMFVMDMFYNNQSVIDFINSLKPLIGVLFAVSLIVVGYQLMFLQNKQFRKIAVNTLIAISVILLLPTAMTKVNGILNDGVAITKGKPQDIVNQIIKANIVDLLKYDKDAFDSEKIKEYDSGNDISKDNIRYIDASETIDPDEVDLKNKEVFKKKLTTNDKGNLATSDLKQSWYNWKEYYFRFDINFINLLISLLAISATMGFTCFKLGKLVFELAYNKALALLIAPADISNGQKTKQIIQNILSIFVVTFMISLLFKFYIIFVKLCADIDGIQGAILLIAGSFAVIDGPNLVERLFGIDAGLQSGFKTMMGAYATGRAIAGGAKAIADKVPKIKSERVPDKNKPNTTPINEGMKDKGNKQEKPKSLYQEMGGGNSTPIFSPIQPKPLLKEKENKEPIKSLPTPKVDSDNISDNKTNNTKANDNNQNSNNNAINEGSNLNQNGKVNQGSNYGSLSNSMKGNIEKEQNNRPQSIYEGMKKDRQAPNRNINDDSKKGGK